jgi:TraM recognition site of TraD and TraG/Type IV secretion-system coupling protein DNA-binding domain
MDTIIGYIDTIIRDWQLILAVICILIAAYWLFVLFRVTSNRRYLQRRTIVWLEITPPARITKTPEATEQLFSVLHGNRAARSLKERLLDRSPVMSFEIVSTRRDGIRYLLQVEKSQSKNTQKAVTSYIPDSKVKEIERKTGEVDKVIEFNQTGHYVLPLTLTSVFEQHDPLAYVTGAMTKLGDDEEITLQLVAKPIRLREADILSHKILGNENILQQVSGKQLTLFGRFTNIFGKASSGLTDLAGEVYMGTAFGHKEYYNSKSRTVQQQARVTTHDRPARTLSAFELELMETMHQKVTRPLFQVNLRILVKSPDATVHISALRSALDGYSVPPYQSLKAKLSIPVIDTLRRRNAMNRLPSLSRRSGLILASTELASLYHFPSSQVSKTDNLITSLSKTLPAPVSLKSGQAFDVVIGENHHHNSSTFIGLTEQERERHEYIIGGTGNGKTTLLQYQIVQDMQNGKGLAIIDPHGDMAETMLRYVPKERIQDVIYFNPDDLEYPLGVNLLELTPGLTGNELLREKDIITESVISVFRKIFSDEDSGGHRIEYVLRNAIQTALTVEDATLFTVFDLLNDPKYRRSVVKTLEDKNLVNFWKNEIGKAGDMQKVKMAAGITAKIGRFLFSACARQILEQPKSTIDFDDIINSGKILICNFSKGLIGEDTSELFGITVLAKLQLASLRRARLKQTERRHFYLYVDEFQNFATTSFVQMLSEARKYKLFMIMAEQSTSQQDDQQMVSIILANVGTVICFRTGNPQDERSLLPLFAPYVEQGEISNLSAFNFYAKLSAVKAQEPLSGQTLLLAHDGVDMTRDAIVQHSRIVFARKKEVQEISPTTDSASKKMANEKLRRPTKKKKTQDTTTQAISRPPGF